MKLIVTYFFQDSRLLSFPQTSSGTDYYTENLITCLDQEFAQLVEKQNEIQSMEPSVLLTIRTSTPEDAITTLGTPTTSKTLNGVDGNPATNFVSEGSNESSKRTQISSIATSSTNSNEPPAKKGPHKCPICSKVFTNWLPFRRHRQEHLNEKPFVCKLCRESFNFEENLKLHEMMHEAESSGCLKCRVCEVKFLRFASFKNHLRVHEKDELCVCQECGDEFSTMAMLKSHIGKLLQLIVSVKQHNPLYQLWLVLLMTTDSISLCSNRGTRQNNTKGLHLQSM